jgi:lipoate-protein ligase A
VYGDFFSDRDPRELEQALIGLPHRRDDLLKVLQDIPLRDYLGQVTAREVLSGLI